MKSKLLFSLLFLFSASVSSAQQSMTDAQAMSFRDNVNTTAKNTRTLATDFTQFKHMDFLSKDIETSGKMHFKSPSMLQWQYVKPYQYSIIFKNNKIYINDAGKKSNIDNNKMFDKLNKLILGSVNGNMFDDKEFTISYLHNNDYNITSLIPKDPTMRKYISKMELYFDKKSHMVSEVRMIENSGDYTKIIFRNKIVNAKINDAIFSH